MDLIYDMITNSKIYKKYVGEYTTPLLAAMMHIGAISRMVGKKQIPILQNVKNRPFLKDDSMITGEIKGILKTGDILIAEPAHYSNIKITHWLAKCSRFLQHTRWGHTGIYDGHGKVLEARVDVLIGRGKEYDGVISRSLENFIKEQNFIIVRPIVGDEGKLQAVERMYKMLKMDYLRYDKFRFIQGGLDILGVRAMKARNIEESGRLICSEAIARAYDGWVKFVDGRHYSQILPVHILNSNRVHPIAVMDRDGAGKLQLSLIDFKQDAGYPRAL